MVDVPSEHSSLKGKDELESEHTRNFPRNCNLRGKEGEGERMKPVRHMYINEQ